jgi:hypothetical protein
MKEKGKSFVIGSICLEIKKKKLKNQTTPEAPKKNEIKVYTDGSSLGNLGEGGWGVIFMTDKSAFELAGAQKKVTNTRLNLKLFIRLLS